MLSCGVVRYKRGGGQASETVVVVSEVVWRLLGLSVGRWMSELWLWGLPDSRCGNTVCLDDGVLVKVALV